MMNNKIRDLLGRSVYEVSDQIRDLRTVALSLSFKTDLRWNVLTRFGTTSVCAPDELCAQWFARGFQIDSTFHHGHRSRGPAYQVNVYELPQYDPDSDKYLRRYLNG